MSKDGRMERNGISIDAGMLSLCDELETRASEQFLPKKGLILAYNFPPFADASSATVAKRIRQFGRSVDVVSQDMTSIRRMDEDLSDLVSEFVEGHFQLEGDPGFASWPSIRNYVLDGYSAVKKALIHQEYGFIYSRSMFPATHFLAAFIKYRHPEVFWVSEFSDPVRHDVEGNLRASQKVPNDYISSGLIFGAKGAARNLLLEDRTVLTWCEVLGVVSADRVIFTNEHQRNAMLEPYAHQYPAEDLIAKSVVSPHPTFVTSFYNKRKRYTQFRASDFINIGYFGEFYPNRGVGELVRAVSGLSPVMRSKFKVHIYTGNVLTARESLGGLSFDTSFVRVSSSKQFFEFLALASEMDALYVCDVSSGLGYDKNPYLPSKVSDYRGADVPIIASVWPGSVLSKDVTLERFLIGDVTNLQKYLSQLG